jgi:hypothetical protein
LEFWNLGTGSWNIRILESTPATLLHGFKGYICGVRIIAFLLAIGILALAVIPCSDGDACADDSHSVTLVDNGGMEQCTPFCICSCCSAHIQLTYLFDIPLTSFAHGTGVITPYFQKPLLPGSSNIWQPPRI